MTIRAVLCFITRDRNVLLLKKSEGLFGQGKWNAPGGKILPGETPEHCAVREVLEETRLVIHEPEQVGIVHFYKYDKRETADWKVDVFLSRSHEGAPVSGREGVLKWFPIDALPFEEMWEDDRYWHKLALAGNRFAGWFYYSGDFEKLVDHRIEKVSPAVRV